MVYILRNYLFTVAFFNFKISFFLEWGYNKLSKALRFLFDPCARRFCARTLLSKENGHVKTRTSQTTGQADCGQINFSYFFSRLILFTKANEYFNPKLPSKNRTSSSR